jgi:hypothetical protein
MKTRLVCVVLAILSTTRFAVAQQGASSITDPGVTGFVSVPRVIRFSGVAKDATGKPDFVGTESGYRLIRPFLSAIRSNH